MKVFIVELCGFDGEASWIVMRGYSQDGIRKEILKNNGECKILRIMDEAMFFSNLRGHV